MRASFIIELDGFVTALEETKVLDISHIDWPSCLKVRLLFLFAYLSWSWHNMDLVFYQISSVYLVIKKKWLAQMH
jgi:hypothetical protein